eukprot:m.29242 g.29242  ORF g.29242 m.29242 type:complete len:141 (+) comp5073_c0_seq1:1330-1752(+)
MAVLLWSDLSSACLALVCNLGIHKTHLDSNRKHGAVSLWHETVPMLREHRLLLPAFVLHSAVVEIVHPVCQTSHVEIGSAHLLSNSQETQQRPAPAGKFEQLHHHNDKRLDLKEALEHSPPNVQYRAFSVDLKVLAKWWW